MFTDKGEEPPDPESPQAFLELLLDRRKEGMTTLETLQRASWLAAWTNKANVEKCLTLNAPGCYFGKSYAFFHAGNL